jgi:hypothetical protein
MQEVVPTFKKIVFVHQRLLCIQSWNTKKTKYEIFQILQLKND